MPGQLTLSHEKGALRGDTRFRLLTRSEKEGLLVLRLARRCPGPRRRGRRRPRRWPSGSWVLHDADNTLGALRITPELNDGASAAKQVNRK